MTPNENFLVGRLSVSDIGIMDLSSEEIANTFRCKNYIRCKAITSDGKYVVSVSDNIQVWDFNTGKQLGILDIYANKIYITKYSKYIIGCGGYDIYIIDFETLDIVYSFEVGDIKTPICDMHISPDENYIATTDGNSIKIWDWRKSKLLNKIT